MAVPTPATLVLDTNAWLDLLVFDDRHLHGVAASVEAGLLRIAIDARALDELDRVLRYPVLALEAARVATCLDAARQLATVVETPHQRLPRCRDPDDQMFLEIAVAAGARWLLTRDAELLRLASRMAREHGLAILEPRAWRPAFEAQMSKR